MELDEAIDFLQTDSLSATFSPRGLKYLSLRGRRGEEQIDLGEYANSKQRNPRVRLLIEETLGFLDSGRHEMPLDLSCFTDFQQRVFEAVSRVEPGEITTYKGIAEVLGKPGAAQAVGSAVAKNPVSFFLPTHRVLPQRGIGICRTGAGYLREKLLAREGHDLSLLRGNYLCPRKNCLLE